MIASLCVSDEVMYHILIFLGTLQTNGLSYYKSNGYIDIQRYFSIHKTPQQNGMAERMNKSLTKRTKCLLLNAGSSKVSGQKQLTLRTILSTGHHKLHLRGRLQSRYGHVILLIFTHQLQLITSTLNARKKHL